MSFHVHREGAIEIPLAVAAESRFFLPEPWHNVMKAPEFVESGIPATSVCDSPAQWLARHGADMEDMTGHYAVIFSKVRRTRRWPDSTFRWDHWGPYIGKGQPTQMFLSDERQFRKGVYVAQVWPSGHPRRR